MQFRQLGSSALRVSEISLGSWLTYGVGVERERGIACVHHAPDSPPPANTRAVSDKMGGFMSDLSTQQLDDTAAASGLKIDPELFAAADAALAKVARF
jgi:aryl-alcohol dehydrogenase-like predicted oxidoreductase